jgi:tetratricopeptide (TPR) repeat protein
MRTHERDRLTFAMQRHDSRLADPPKACAGWVWIVLLSTIFTAPAHADDFQALAERVTSKPEDWVAGNELRRWCRAKKKVDDCVDFFEKVVAAHPTARGVRYNAALAYIDKLPGHSLLVQAKLSTNSIGHATAVIENSPDDWLALYIRGLNNLYWPKWYRRAGRTAMDMQRLVDFAEKLPPDGRRSWMALAYIGLGDAYALLDQPKEALETWRRGAALFNSAELNLRLKFASGQVERSIEEIRSRENPVDTDLKFYQADTTAAVEKPTPPIPARSSGR